MERCGAFDSYNDAGCVCFIWPCYSIGEKLSLKVQKLEVELKTKTIDDVFISVSTVVNIQVKKDRLYQAFYSMRYREHQLCQFVKDGTCFSLLALLSPCLSTIACVSHSSNRIIK
jgi:hypothetical protein